MRELKVLNKYFLKYKWHFLLGVLFVALSNVFRILMPRTIRDALNYVFENIQAFKAAGSDGAEQLMMADLSKQLLVFAAMVLGFALVMGFFMYCMRQTIIVMSRLIEFDMRNEIFEHFAKMDLSFYKKNKTGDLMARISEDVNKVRMYLGPAILYFINLVSLFTIVITSMLSVSFKLTLWTLLPLPVLSVSIYIVSNIINKRSAVIQKQLGVINAQAQEVYSGIRVIKSYAKEDQFVEYFENSSNDYRFKSLRLARVNAMFFPLMILLVSISTMLTLYIGALQLEAGAISPGNIAEFIIYVGMLTWPITSLGWIASLVQQAAASQARINECMQVESNLKSTGSAPMPAMNIAFDQVGFRYPETGIKALDQLSFKVNKGERVAIVGKTASGKSTIADLLVRMYDVDEGSISIDGIALDAIDLSELRQKIAYVPQDVFLFSDTIRNNIKFGMHHEIITDEAVEQAAKYASIHDDIMSLPEGYDTMVGERGVTLSGGQKQRISLSRALLKDPDLIILDDCLSAVDAKTENAIVHYFNTSLQDKTTIVITHRVHTEMNYDRIIVLDQGRIAEIGTHEELLQNKSVYYDLMSHSETE